MTARRKLLHVLTLDRKYVYIYSWEENKTVRAATGEWMRNPCFSIYITSHYFPYSECCRIFSVFPTLLINVRHRNVEFTNVTRGCSHARADITCCRVM